MTTNAKLKTSVIHVNPLNEGRSISKEEVTYLASSINEKGLLQPLVVYFDTDNGYYVLISGHRRLEACKTLGMDEVPVVIIDEEKDFTTEQELLLQSNIHRSSEEDAKKELVIAGETWDSMDKYRQDKFSEILKKNYLNRGNNDLKGYRPKLEYIKMMCGSSLSYRTIYDRLGSKKDNFEEILDENEPKKKSKTKKNKKVRTLKEAATSMVDELRYLISPEAEELQDAATVDAIEQIILKLLPFIDD